MSNYIPIFIDGEEIVERTRLHDGEDFTSYLIRVSEGRGFYVVSAHPHDKSCAVLGIHIGAESPSARCSVEGCGEDPPP